jgi:hypothetical protein
LSEVLVTKKGANITVASGRQSGGNESGGNESGGNESGGKKVRLEIVPINAKKGANAPLFVDSD